MISGKTSSVGRNTRSQNTPNSTDQTASQKPASGSTGTLPRELMRWLQGLDLEHSFKNLKRDFANGYVIAEILSRYYPKEIHIPAYYSGSSSAAKKNNWEQLDKVLKKIGSGDGLSLSQKLRISKESIEKLSMGHEGSLLKFLLSLYEHVNRRRMLASTSQYAFSTSSLPGAKASLKSEGKHGSDIEKEKALTEIEKMLGLSNELGGIKSSLMLFQEIDIKFPPSFMGTFFKEISDCGKNPFSGISVEDTISVLSEGLNNDIMSNSFQFSFEMLCTIIRAEKELEFNSLRFVFESLYENFMTSFNDPGIDDLLDKIPYVVSMIDVYRSEKTTALEDIFSLFRDYPLAFDCWVAFFLRLVEAGQQQEISLNVILGTLEWIDSRASELLRRDPTRFSTILIISVLLENRELFLEGSQSEEARLILHEIITTHIDWRQLVRWTMTALQGEKMVAILLYFITMLIHTDPGSFSKIVIPLVVQSNWHEMNSDAFFLFLSTWPQLKDNDIILQKWVDSLIETSQKDFDCFTKYVSSKPENSSFKAYNMDVASCISWTTNIPITSFRQIISSEVVRPERVLRALVEHWSSGPLDRLEIAHFSLIRELISVDPKITATLFRNFSEFILLGLINPPCTGVTTDLLLSCKSIVPDQIEKASKGYVDYRNINLFIDETKNFINPKIDRGKRLKSTSRKNKNYILRKMAETNPLFMTDADMPQNVEENPFLMAIQSLIYDGTPKEVAENFKNQGNEAFSIKDYDNAFEFYNRGIAYLEEKDDGSDSTVPTLYSTILSNRSAIHLIRENYGSAVRDCIWAIRKNPKNLKAYFRAANACFTLGKFEDCLRYAKEGLDIEPKNIKLAEFQEKAEQCISELRRKKEAEKTRTQDQELSLASLKKSLQKVGVSFLSSSSAPDIPAANPVPFVYLDGLCPPRFEGSSVLFSVVILYPEFSQSDFIGEFALEDTFAEHLNQMLVEQPAPWDSNHSYCQLQNLAIYFNGWEDGKKMVKKMVPVNLNMTLLDALSLGYEMHEMTPVFSVTLQESPNNRNGIEIEPSCQ